MALLFVGTIIFFTIHFYSAFRSRAPGKDIKERMGEGPYMGLYSVASGFGLGLMIYGYIIAPPTGNLYIGPEWARHATMTLMLIAFILLVAAYIPGTHMKKHQQKALLFGSFLVFAIIDFVAASRRAETSPAAPASAIRDIASIVIGGGVFAVMLFWGHELLFGVAPIIR